MPTDENTLTPAELDLHYRAREAAGELYAEMAEIVPAELEEFVRSALAIAWLDGRQSGGDEAKAIVGALLEELRGQIGES